MLPKQEQDYAMRVEYAEGITKGHLHILSLVANGLSLPQDLVNYIETVTSRHQRDVTSKQCEMWNKTVDTQRDGLIEACSPLVLMTFIRTFVLDTTSVLQDMDEKVAHIKGALFSFMLRE